VQPDPALTWMSFFVAWFAVAAVLPGDARRHKVSLALDWGWYVSAGWPVVWLWYVRHTGRSWRMALALVALPFAFDLGNLVGLFLGLIIESL